MSNTKKQVLISGASVAGPTLAYWLKRFGFEPTVVERAPQIRAGGYPIDVRYEAAEVAMRMGIWPRLQREQTTLGKLVFVGAHHQPINEVNVQGLTKSTELERFWVEIMRGDLACVLYEQTKDDVEYIFSDSIQTFTESEEGVEITFEHTSPRRFDLVVGADGLHSQVRALAFGDEAQFEHYSSYQVSVFGIDNYLKLDRATILVNGVPGKQVYVRSPKGDGVAGAMFIWKQPQKLRYDRHNREEQKRLLASIFADQQWEVPKLLEQLQTTPDLYFDSVSQIRMETWHRGRIVLLGDAAYCPALLTGYGSTLAMIGAYILAGELSATPDDCRAAFQRYEQAFKPYVEKEQKKLQSGADFLIPGTPLGLWARNHLAPMLARAVLVPEGIVRRLHPWSSMLKSYENTQTVL
ncbi:FAD-dependent oxidoreductase [Reticulibacter mediterranei]|uniref:FAD-dependent oxidoreductase n=1 Tax=Reticulibacter mediterranei TaxID=2778369 RepID=A0A8J3IVP4_9CHLR|nr:FAD-dependent monooxygenase [Reticulibacter mediterranei]GHO97632.1 FAD-dependent oxidoreductase [Reticulibacter mediterranei]